MEKIDVFVQGEGVKEVILVQVAENGRVRDLIEIAKEHGIRVGGESDPSGVFLEEGEDALFAEAFLGDVGIRHRGHVHIHRARQIDVMVSYNGRQEARTFPPSATVGRVKKWAVSKKVFNLSEVDAAEHVLQIAGSSERPDETTHLGTLLTYPAHEIHFDLVPKVRVEG